MATTQTAGPTAPRPRRRLLPPAAGRPGTGPRQVGRRGRRLAARDPSKRLQLADSFAADPGPAALRDRYGVGRPSVWTAALQALLLAALQRRPEELGYAGVNWTVPLIQEHLDYWGGRRLSEDTIRRELDRLGYVWKRFRYVLPPDPQRDKKTRHPASAAGTAAAQRQAGL